MKVFVSPDNIPGGWLGSKHHLTNCFWNISVLKIWSTELITDDKASCEASLASIWSEMWWVTLSDQNVTLSNVFKRCWNRFKKQDRYHLDFSSLSTYFSLSTVIVWWKTCSAVLKLATHTHTHTHTLTVQCNISGEGPQCPRMHWGFHGHGFRHGKGRHGWHGKHGWHGQKRGKHGGPSSSSESEDSDESRLLIKK